MNNAKLTEIAGVSVPDSRLATAAAEFAQAVSEPFLFHHVVRSYGFGAAVAESANLPFDRELLFVAAILHDVGLTNEAPGDERFEIEGADIAKRVLSEAGMSDAKLEVVWDAIALHTTLGVPQRKRPEIALVQTGAAIDIGVVPRNIVPAPFVARLLEEWPRLGMKKKLVSCLHGLHTKSPKAARSYVVADVAEREDPSFQRPNLCDAINAADFSE